jgi:hypothetical protein
MTVLMIASERNSADGLRAARAGASGDAEIMCVAPAPADETIGRAGLVLGEPVEGLDDAGFDAGGATGESDPVSPSLVRARPTGRVVSALRRGTKRSALYSCHGGRLDTQGHSTLLRIRFAQGHRRPAVHGDLTDSFVPSFREPFLDNSRSERPLGQPRRARRLRWFSSHRLSRWGRRQME